MKFLSQLKSKSLAGKICLLRVDYNVDPPTDSGQEDSLRLGASLPTIRFLLKNKVKVIILSHRGRPSGKDQNLSLKFVIPFLEKNLNEKVGFAAEIPDSLPNNALVLLENLRFWPEEEKNDSEFAQKLARLGDFYVNDAFAVCHRENASVTQLPKLVPSYAGLLLEQEIQNLSQVMEKPKKPLVLIFGGAKIEDKLPTIRNLLPKSNRVLLGSGILNIHNSLSVIHDSKIVKPMDWIGENNKALDIGPTTIKKYEQEIKKAKTIIWNGPVGLFENPKYRDGSVAIAKAITKSNAFSVVGGGETTVLFLSAIPNYKFLISKKRLFLSTGGGAMLEFLSGKELPGIKTLS